MTADEASLLDAWGDGDAAAAGVLMSRYYDRVYRFFDVRASAAADDLTQRTFLACMENRARLRDLVGFRSFLFGIARNQLLRHFHERRRVDRASEFADLMSSEAVPTASRIVALHQEQQLLLRALSSLPVDTQVCLQLFYWEGMRSAEVAEVLGTNVSVVTSRLSRARASLRKAVEELHAAPRPRESVLSDMERWVRSIGELELEPAVRYRGPA